MSKEWELIEKLEEDNMALTIAARNAMARVNKKSPEKIELDNLKKKYKKLKGDNKFLKMMVLRSNNIAMSELGQLLTDLNNKESKQ